MSNPFEGDNKGGSNRQQKLGDRDFSAGKQTSKRRKMSNPFEGDNKGGSNRQQKLGDRDFSGYYKGGSNRQQKLGDRDFSAGKIPTLKSGPLIPMNHKSDSNDEKPGDDDEEKGINFQVAHNFRKVAREHDQEDQNKEKETEDNLTKKLTDEQKEIFTLVKDAAQGKGQILLSVNNGPGTGKTTTLQTVEAVLALTGGKRVIKNSATTGAAATVFGPGTVTLHSALHISTRK
jgi:hypothetical protein